MSRIWQALRQAERERALAREKPPEIEEMDREPASEDEAMQSARSERDRRKGLRHSHATLLLVYGSDAEKQPFHEESETIDANENGCLLVLESDVAKGQKLFLTNMRNQAEQECRVVYVGRRVKGKSRIGVEFPRPMPQFWRLA
jgi:PilZ domain